MDACEIILLNPRVLQFSLLSSHDLHLDVSVAVVPFEVVVVVTVAVAAVAVVAAAAAVVAAAAAVVAVFVQWSAVSCVVAAKHLVLCLAVF